MHDDAIANYSNALEIIEKLIDKEPTSQRRHYLSLTQNSMGDALKAQGKLDLALKAYQAEAEAAKSAIDANAEDDLVQAGSNVGALVYDFVLAHDFAKALETADIANSLAPAQVWIHGKRAHALMFLGRTNEARDIYLGFRGQKSRGDKSWDADVLGDFADLRKHGLSNPLMDEMKKLLRASK